MTKDTCPGFNRETHEYERRSALQEPGGLCPSCRNRKRIARISAERSAAGLCPRCGKNRPPDGRRYCDECVQNTNEARKRRRAT